MIRVMVLVVTSFLAGVASVKDVNVHILSFNIRTSLATIDASSPCSHWDGIRKENVIRNIKTVAADFVGTQETSDAQKAYLDAQLADTYAVIGESSGHLNGMASEWNAMYYRSDTWQVVTNGMFWLGTDPNVMSAGWGMVYYRTCVWGRFQHRETGASICVLNTHYETPGNDEAQKQGSNIILQQIKTKCDASDGLVVLMGDFNALKSYPAMQILFASNMNDPSDEGTFCGSMVSSTCSVKYDFTLFHAQNKDACYLKSEISRINYDGCYTSDHAGLVGSFCLQGSCCSNDTLSDSGSVDFSLEEDLVASDSDIVGKVRGTEFADSDSSEKTRKSDAKVDQSDKGSTPDTESTSAPRDSPQTISVSSGGDSSASTTVGIVLGSLGVCGLVALVVVQRKEMLARKAHFEKAEGATTTNYLNGSTAARAVSDTSTLSPLPIIGGDQASSSPIPELAAPRDTLGSACSAVSLFNAKGHLGATFGYISNRRLAAAKLTASGLEYSVALGNTIVASKSDSNTLEKNHAQPNISSSAALSKVDYSEMAAQESSKVKDSNLSDL